MTANPEGPSNTVGKHNDGNASGQSGYFVSTAWSGSESNTESPFVLPSTDLIKIKYPVPIKDNSTIEFVSGDKPRPGNPPKDPIKITLNNGRTISMTWDEFKRAGGSSRIAKGKNLVWTLFPKGEFYQVQSIQ